MIKEILPCTHIDIKIEVPGSKSITHRALIISSLALGKSVIKGALLSDDTIYTMNALKKMGVDIKEAEDGIHISGINGKPVPLESKTEIYVGNSGTSARFLCSFAALSKKEILITGDERLKQRPMEDLLRVLNENGVDLKFLEKEWHIPVIIKGPLIGGLFLLPKAQSSQFISSLLMVAPCIPYGMELAIKEIPVSGSYIWLTLEVMRTFGINYRASEDLRLFRIAPQPYRAREFTVEGDASSAAYFWAVAAVTKGKVKITNINPDSKQADIGFLKVLEKMGCNIKYDDSGVTVEGRELRGIEVDMNEMPDQVPTLAVIALFAKGKTIITNVPHLREKESDRLKAISNEISKLGGKVKELKDGLVIEGEGKLHGADIETYNDHRIAMSFAIAGLRINGVKIRDAECVTKSFPNFWEIWEKLYHDRT